MLRAVRGWSSHAPLAGAARLAAILALALLTGCGALTPAAPPAAPAQAAPTKLTVGYDGVSMTSAPLVFMKEQGYFARYGLDVDLLLVEGGTKLTAAIVGGSVPVAQNAYSGALSAALQGADLVLVGGLSNKLPFQLVVKSQYANLDSLRGSGAKLAISSPGSSTDVALRAIMKSQALQVGKDVTVLTVGGENERAAAIETGQIDGMMAQYPLTGVLEAKGYRVVGNAADVVDIPNNATVTSRKYLGENRPTVKRYLQALIDGLHAYKTSPDAAQASTAAYLKVPADQAGPAWVYYTKSIYPDVPRPTLSGIKNLLDQELSQTIPAARTAKPEDFVDTSLLDELEKEGFTKQILGR